MRLLTWQNVSWQNRAHFVAMAARLMRNILVDIARRRAKDADGFSVRVVDIAASEHVARERPRDVVLLDDALKELAKRTLGKRASSRCDSLAASTWKRSRR